jgi:hypothetical protein
MIADASTCAAMMPVHTFVNNKWRAEEMNGQRVKAAAVT